VATPSARLRDAITDVPGIKVGHWTNRRAATGCTAVLCMAGAVGGVDVRGAAPGTRETDLLRPDNLVQEVHGVLITGGSAFGLDAASGVMRYLEEQGAGFAFAGSRVPIVPAANLFDLGLGSDRRPDATAGYRASKRATGGAVAEGSVGAGTGATVAKSAGRDRLLKGGLGTASELLDTGVVVGAIVAVNAGGSIRDPRTGEVVAAPRADGAGFIDLDAHLRTGRAWPSEDDDDGETADDQTGDGDGGSDGDDEAGPQNTTLAVIATNARLTKPQAGRLATVCHDGFARTIWPAHTMGDGDVVFALATGEVELELGGLGALEAMASRAVERAILRGVRLAAGLAGVPSASEWAASR
jgi:L-aminopeptidase/D-esterase-like protein